MNWAVVSQTLQQGKVEEPTFRFQGNFPALSTPSGRTLRSENRQLTWEAYLS